MQKQPRLVGVGRSDMMQLYVFNCFLCPANIQMPPKPPTKFEDLPKPAFVAMSKKLGVKSTEHLISATKANRAPVRWLTSAVV